MRKEFCLWVVGGSRGQVRKVRFSVRSVLCVFGLGLLIGSGFLFIASDYARVQLQRAESYFRLKRVLEENRALEGTAQSLQSTVEGLQQAKERALTYEEQILARLEELDRLLNASDPGKILGPVFAGDPKVASHLDSITTDRELQALRPGEAGKKGSEPLAVMRSEGYRASTVSGQDGDGVGGAEVDCPVGAGSGSLGCAPLIDEGSHESSINNARASLKLSSLSDSSSDVVAAPWSSRGGAVVLLLDRYIETLKVTPIGVPAPGHISSGYGFRHSPFHGGPSMHQGVDFSLPYGSPIHSTADGVVEKVIRNGTYGLMVDIRHTPRVLTRYAHLSKAFVTEGEKICRGEVLGLVGSSGRSTAPHLHYEVRVDGRSTNPLPFMRLALEVRQVFVDALLESDSSARPA
jgi:murein DD-endopeptidase MepM/ murein hydrolase activator NlpD